MIIHLFFIKFIFAPKIKFNMSAADLSEQEIQRREQEEEIKRFISQIDKEIDTFKCKTDELLCEITIQMLELLRKY